jgi:hypothetical protein
MPRDIAPRGLSVGQRFPGAGIPAGRLGFFDVGLRRLVELDRQLRDRTCEPEWNLSVSATAVPSSEPTSAPSSAENMQH